MASDHLEAAANRAFDEALDRMGADVCIWSVDLAMTASRRISGRIRRARPGCACCCASGSGWRSIPPTGP
jgi:hypothetical protein